jgi:K+-sensing histidine kinase KdpD
MNAMPPLANGLGARWHEIEDEDPARAIVSFARENQITQIVIGSIQRSWWHIPGGGPIVRRVIQEAGASGIDVHLIARREPPRAERPSREPPRNPELARSQAPRREVAHTTGGQRRAHL